MPLGRRIALDESSRPREAMKILRNAETVCLELSRPEVPLLVRALERASFIDTPVEEQAAIAAFAARALEALRTDDDPV